MKTFRKFLKKQKLKLTLRPYTFYPDADIQYITEFKNGFAPALVKRDIDRFMYLKELVVGVIDSSYNIATYTQYTCRFRETWANGYMIAVNKNYDNHNSNVFLDKELKEVPNRRFHSIQAYLSWFIVGAIAKDSPNDYQNQLRYGILDSDLNEILPRSYKKITPISSTRFFCSLGEEKNPIVFDAITRNTFVLESVSELDTELENGYYKFQSNAENHLYGYLDNNFNIVIKPKYTTLGDFDKSGFAPFTRDDVIGVINMQGEEFIR